MLLAAAIGDISDDSSHQGERGSSRMRTRKLWAALAAVGALAAVILATGAATGRAVTPPVTFTLTGAPSPTTQGGNVGFTGTITNGGTQTLAHVKLVESVPHATLVFTSFSRPVTCGPVTGDVLTCDLGNLAAHGSITFTKIYTTAHEDTSVVDTSYITFLIGSTTNTRCANGGLHTPCPASVTTPLASASDPNFFASWVGFGGQGAHIGTDPQLTHDNTESTQASIPFRADLPNGIPVTILERPENVPNEDCGTGFTCTGQVHDVTVPGTFSIGSPLVLTFGVPATEHETPLVFHDGVGPLPFCSHTPLSTESPACVDSITPDGSGNFIVVVQTLTNGGWRFG